MTFLCALLIAGCGGGDATRTEATSADTVQIAAVHARDSAASKTKTSDGATWTTCASENQSCAFPGIRQVRYGANSKFATRELAGPANCNNATFGDPIRGVVKTCATSSAGAWTSCASENGQCQFTGTRQVRYGTVATYALKTFTNGVACNNDVFGDPLVGVGKSCWFANDASVPAPVPEPPPVASADQCETLPPLPALPSSYNVVTAFCPNGKCAKPDDDIDDTDAIDQALDQSAGKFLVFPPGKYLITRSLRVKQSGVTLWGPGATIHGTNPDDQSIIVEANNTSIYSFTLTAVTKERGSTAEQTRIAIYGPASVNPIVKNTVIRNNQIVNAGAPGTDLANSATGAGIFVNAADGFLIAGNTVARSLADGIHLTGGARNGRVLQNTVRETGDDMIAMVSYAYPDPNANTAATIAPNFSTNVGIYRDTNILVANNVLSGQYWGRGISVVGGANITIRGNTLTNIPYAAAVLLARETQSGTYGVSNVLVENNTITDEQTLSPPYDFENTFASHSRTGHGAFEVQASMFNDELAYPEMVSGFAVTNIAIRNNTVTSSATPGARVGVGTGTTWTMGTRKVTGNAPLNEVSIDGNVMTGIRVSTPIQILAASGAATCTGDTNGGVSLTGINLCPATTAKAVTTGATLSCPKN